MFKPVRILNVVSVNRALRAMHDRIVELEGGEVTPPKKATAPVAPVVPESADEDTGGDADAPFDWQGCEDLDTLRTYAEASGIALTAKATVRSIKTKIKQLEEGA